eukprot:gene11027-biopygen1408
MHRIDCIPLVDHVPWERRRAARAHRVACRAAPCGNA